MADIHTQKQRSKNMAAIRSSNNKSTELRLVELLRKYHVKGWKRGSRFYGKPDFVFSKNKITVFVDGCFWHGCKESFILPKTNRKFWKQKIERNMERDRQVSKLLRKEGWKVIRIWEHEIKKKPEITMRKIENALKRKAK